MTPIILKTGPNRDARHHAVVDATLGWIFQALAWAGTGWLGYVLLDSHASAGVRLAVLGATAACQSLAITAAALARRYVKA